MQIDTSHRFERELKRLVRKHPSVLAAFETLCEQLADTPFTGQSLGFGCYKIRLPIAEKGGGKSGGARVITHVQISEDTINMLTIYDKAERATIPDKEIKKIIKEHLSDKN